MFLHEQPAASSSLNSSSVDQEQQSPASVLSAFFSETVGSADSGMLDCSLSPHEISKHGVYLLLEPNPMVQENASQFGVHMHVQLELFPKAGFVKEGSTEATSSKSPS